MHVTAKSDYAVRAMLILAAHEPELVKIDTIVETQSMPRKFVEAILGDLRRANLVRSQRGAEGGYGLAKPASEIPIAAIIRAVDGPLAEVRGVRPDEGMYDGVAANLAQVWIAVRASLRSVLDETTLAHVLSGKFPKHVQKMYEAPDAWLPR